MLSSMKRTLALAAVLAGAVVAGSAARAQLVPGGGQQMMCGNRAEIVRQLSRKYGETRRSMGITGQRGVVEVFASDATGSWTILLTNPQGLTCLMAAGVDFEDDLTETAGNSA